MSLFMQWGEQQWLLAGPYDSSSLHCASLRKLWFALRGARVFSPDPIEWKRKQQRPRQEDKLAHAVMQREDPSPQTTHCAP